MNVVTRARRAVAYPPCVDRVVEARAVVKRFGAGRGARTVLDHVDLDLERGELVAIVGRSGSGKSTLLHLVGGLDRADAGTIAVAGERVDRLSETGLARLRARRIGFVFQFFHLLPELTGEENVMLAARLAGNGRDATRRGAELIQRLGVGEVAGQLPTVMSGGEQQRFAIARALINDPVLILADEPTGNLDSESGGAVLQVLRELADDGRAVLLVTHDPAATAVADRVLELADGRFPVAV